jgi:hypothetical protein
MERFWRSFQEPASLKPLDNKPECDIRGRPVLGFSRLVERFPYVWHKPNAERFCLWNCLNGGLRFFHSSIPLTLYSILRMLIGMPTIREGILQGTPL